MSDGIRFHERAFQKCPIDFKGRKKYEKFHDKWELVAAADSLDVLDVVMRSMKERGVFANGHFTYGVHCIVDAMSRKVAAGTPVAVFGISGSEVYGSQYTYGLEMRGSRFDEMFFVEAEEDPYDGSLYFHLYRATDL